MLRNLYSLLFLLLLNPLCNTLWEHVFFFFPYEQCLIKNKIMALHCCLIEEELLDDPIIMQHSQIMGLG